MTRHWFPLEVLTRQWWCGGMGEGHVTSSAASLMVTVVGRLFTPAVLRTSVKTQTLTQRKKVEDIMLFYVCIYNVVVWTLVLPYHYKHNVVGITSLAVAFYLVNLHSNHRLLF